MDNIMSGFKIYLNEQTVWKSYIPVILKEEELFEDLKINYTSKIYEKLVAFVKEKKAQAKDIAMFIRYHLINTLKKVTNKGKVLLFGGAVDLTEPDTEYTEDMVINAVTRFKKKLKGEKDIEDEDLEQITKSKPEPTTFPWYAYMGKRKKWEPVAQGAKGARPAFSS
jgi:hypothetical protein